MKRVLIGLATVAVVAGGAGPAFADTISFGNITGQGGGGTVVSTPGGLSVVNGGISKVIDLNTGVTYTITGLCGGFGCLNLTTGLFIGPGLAPNSWLFADNPGPLALTIVGTTSGGAAGMLYNGGFDPLGDTVLKFDTNASGVPTGFGNVSGSLDGGTLNGLLASQFGVLPATTSGDNTNDFFQFIFTPALTQPFGSGLDDTNVVKVVATAIPEPGSMALLGTGLLGLARVARRRFAKI